MYTKQDLILDYKKETGEKAYYDKGMIAEYAEWLEEKLIEIKNRDNGK
jgi:hypothetical protein